MWSGGLLTRPEAQPVLPFPMEGVGGFAFDIQGPAACPFQFYMTDSTRHFLRGALYFNAKMQPDSLAPMIQFMKQDMTKMMETIEWKK